jgi:hypothetical protein
MTLAIETRGGVSDVAAFADTEPDAVSVANDPALALLALILQNRGAQSNAAREDVNHANEMLEQSRREIQEAMKRAAEADQHSGFWSKLGAVFSGDIGAIAEIIGAAAVIVATGGAGAAGVLAIAATGLSAGAEVGQKLGLDPKICLALSGAAAVAGIAVGKVPDVSEFCATVEKGCKIVGSAAMAASVGATTVAGQYQADAADAQTDATRARAVQADASFDFNIALDMLARAARDTSRAEGTAAKIEQAESDGRASLMARLGTA